MTSRWPLFILGSLGQKSRSGGHMCHTTFLAITVLIWLFHEFLWLNDFWLSYCPWRKGVFVISSKSVSSSIWKTLPKCTMLSIISTVIQQKKKHKINLHTIIKVTLIYKKDAQCPLKWLSAGGNSDYWSILSCSEDNILLKFYCFLLDSSCTKCMCPSVHPSPSIHLSIHIHPSTLHSSTLLWTTSSTQHSQLQPFFTEMVLVCSYIIKSLLEYFS